MTLLPEHPLPPKPVLGSPCNHCGLCCHRALCNVAIMTDPTWVAPCPMLVILGGRALCGFMMTEIAHGLDPVVQKSLGAGAGCSMDDELIKDPTT